MHVMSVCAKFEASGRNPGSSKHQKSNKNVVTMCWSHDVITYRGERSAREMARGPADQLYDEAGQVTEGQHDKSR